MVDLTNHPWMIYGIIGGDGNQAITSEDVVPVFLIISLLVEGCGLGFTAAVQPGPLQTYILTQTLRYGWRRALPTIFAPLFSDGPVIVLTLFVLVQLPASILSLIQVAGGVFILYLAWSTFKE